MGEFDRDGSIEIDRWKEIDANADRLLIRRSDQLREYDWANLSEPIVTPLGNPDPTIEAIDDEYTLVTNGESPLLDVLANDNIYHIGFSPTTEIVELIGAPEGAEIVDGHSIRLPASALTDVQTLRFEYVISNGEEESTAVVEVNVLAIRELLVELSLHAVDSDGESLEQITQGQEFWLEFRGDDLRESGTGVYAAFFDLELPSDLLEITGPIEYGDGFTGVANGEFDGGFINDVGAVSNLIEPSGNAIESLLRIGVRATGAGQVRLHPESADAPGTAALLRGRQTEVPEDRVRYTVLELNIVPETTVDSLDSNGDGNVSALDALVVINFLSKYGTVEVSDLARLVNESNGEGEAITDASLERLQRLDTNRSGSITALDALVVVNKLSATTLAEDLASNRPDEEGEELDVNWQVSTIVAGPKKITSFD